MYKCKSYKINLFKDLIGEDLKNNLKQLNNNSYQLKILRREMFLLRKKNRNKKRVQKLIKKVY